MIKQSWSNAQLSSVQQTGGGNYVEKFVFEVDLSTDGKLNINGKYKVDFPNISEGEYATIVVSREIFEYIMSNVGYYSILHVTGGIEITYPLFCCMGDGQIGYSVIYIIDDKPNLQLYIKFIEQ